MEDLNDRCLQLGGIVSRSCWVPLLIVIVVRFVVGDSCVFDMLSVFNLRRFGRLERLEKE